MRVSTVAILILASSLAGCFSLTPKEPEAVWRSTEVSAPTGRVLWKIGLLAVEQSGFPLTGDRDPASGTVTSGWRTELHPFSGKGNRQRVELRFEVQGQRRWLVKVRVQRQLNMALANPLDPTRAEWEWAPENPVQADILLRHIVSAFDPELELRGADPSARTPGRN